MAIKAFAACNAARTECVSALTAEMSDQDGKDIHNGRNGDKRTRKTDSKGMGMDVFKSSVSYYIMCVCVCLGGKTLQTNENLSGYCC